jgi:NADPH:quinone reductase-like Zn-dependent oxidoreductase
MKAVLYHQYGPPDVLQITEVEKPTPKEHEVLIRTRATTVTAGDWRVRSLEVPRGMRLMARLALGVTAPRQKILGSELSGEIESVGRNVRRFKPGDEVFAFTNTKLGCHAEYKCLPEDAAVALKPSNLTFDEAAAISFGGTTALHFVRKGKLERGEQVLVNGASGAVGMAAVQLARHFGAEVTGVCSTANVELVKSLGATRVIDYTREDFTRSGETWDVIIDTAGTAPFSRARSSLAEKGRLLVVLGNFADFLRAPFVNMSGSRKVITGTAGGRAEDLRFLAELAEAGEFRPFIDRRYPLEQIVEAHRYVDSGRKRGNVVITMGHEH